MSQITRAELDAWGDRLTASMKETLELHVKALPCAQHDAALGRISDKSDKAQESAQEAYTTAQLAKQQAETAKDIASGNLWKLAKFGIAGLATAAGIKMQALSGWVMHAADAIKHHK